MQRNITLHTPITSFLGWSMLLLSSLWISSVRPLTFDLPVYIEWLRNPDYYTFDPGFQWLGVFIRSFTQEVRVLIFAVSLLVQFSVIRLTKSFFPSLSVLPMIIVGVSAYWHLSLGTNVLRQGLALSIGVLVITFLGQHNKTRFYIAATLSTLVHWASAIYFVVYAFVKDGLLKNLRLKLLIMAIGLILAYIAISRIDLMGKLSIYLSQQLYDDTRLSQIPRYILQSFLLLSLYTFKIGTSELRKPVPWMIILLTGMVFFPEAFSRFSLITGLYLHIIWFGTIFSSQRTPYGLKMLFSIIIFLVQFLHPSNLNFLGF